jgi:glycosyltransferase involved in cell wall biosynthesis
MRVEDLPSPAPPAGGLGASTPLRIVHCLRAPVGGLFRHVRDLAEAQAGAGHSVGVICDSITGGAFEEEALAGIAPFLALGLRRLPMRRQVSPSDIAAAVRLTRDVRSLDPDILHGHGAKGGAYARLIGTVLRASGSRVTRIYSPHGGSLHYDPRSVAGRVYFAAERGLESLTDAFVFVSRFEADAYAAKVGTPSRASAIVLNGLREAEFVPVAPHADARDFLFIGTLRDLKGPDVFIEALSRLRGEGRSATALIVGDGEDKTRCEAMVGNHGLTSSVAFAGPMPAREAFALARTVVVPSRAESMPYIVLEAIAAGVPVVATNVGGIPEIFGAEAHRLVPPGNAEALAAAMAAIIADPVAAHAAAGRLREALRPAFSTTAMARSIEAVYRSAMTPRG